MAVLFLLASCFVSVLVVYNLPRFHNIPEKAIAVDARQPLSALHPVEDLGLAAFQRPDATAPPHHRFLGRTREHGLDSPVPTNAWYQNLLMVDGEPSNLHRAYSTPYLLDMVGPFPGLRVHTNHILASTQVLQLTFNENFGMVLGAEVDLSSKKGKTSELSKAYKIKRTTELGVTLKWVRIH